MLKKGNDYEIGWIRNEDEKRQDAVWLRDVRRAHESVHGPKHQKSTFKIQF